MKRFISVMSILLAVFFLIGAASFQPSSATYPSGVVTGAGSTASPSLRWSSEATGLYFPAPKVIGLAFEGSGRLWLSYDATTGYIAPIDPNTVDLGLSGFEFRHIYSKGSIIMINPVSSGTTPRAQWIFMQSTAGLGSGAHSFIEMQMGKDQVALPNANGLYINAPGDFNMPVHVNIDPASDGSVGIGVGMHGTNSTGIGFDCDDTNNTCKPIRIFQGGANGSSSQNLIEINAETDFLTGAFGGAFTGDVIDFMLRGVSKFRLDYLGNLIISGGLDTPGADISTAGTLSERIGSPVASASAITISGNIFHVTGTTGITSISGTGVSAGTCVVLIFDGILTVTDGSNLKLAGNFTTSADDTLRVCYDGTNWYEIDRSVN